MTELGKAAGDTPVAKRRSIVFFAKQSAPPLDETGMMSGVFSPTVESGLSEMRERGYDEGHVLKCLFNAPGLSLVHIWFKANFPLPAHFHDCDCTYYVIAGELHMGSRIVREGEGFFIPAKAGYSYTAGPNGLQLLEFRATNKFDITIPDGSQEYWKRMADVVEANQELWKTQRPPLASNG